MRGCRGPINKNLSLSLSPSSKALILTPKVTRYAGPQTGSLVSSCLSLPLNCPEDQFRDSFLSILIFPTVIIDKSVEANVVEESGGAHHSVSIFPKNLTFFLLKIEVVTSLCFLTLESTRSLSNSKILYKFDYVIFKM